MHPVTWVPPATGDLLDVGCNVGELLEHCRRILPHAHLVGTDVNAGAIDAARRCVPSADLLVAPADALPFSAERFDCVTCIEVLEHVPPERRRKASEEMRRVLRPGGRLVLRVPHAGLFAWLDPHNVRFRFPRLYRLVAGAGGREEGCPDGAGGIVWHHHFARRELLALTGAGWVIEAVVRGGLVVIPVAGFVLWPFYRTGRTHNLLVRALERAKAAELGWNFGAASYGILMVLRRA